MRQSSTSHDYDIIEISDEHLFNVSYDEFSI